MWKSVLRGCGSPLVPCGSLTEEGAVAGFLDPGKLSVRYALVLAAGCLAASVGDILAAVGQERAPDRPLKYVAKMICGTQPDPENLQLVRGRYLTAVNLLNQAGHQVDIHASVALAYPPPGLTAGAVHTLPPVSLETGKSLAIHCGDLKAHVFKFGFPDSYIDGFLAIESNGPLSVSAVYTAAPLIDKECCKAVVGPVASVDIEEVAATETGSIVERADLEPVAPQPDSDPPGAPGTGFCGMTGANSLPRVAARITNVGLASAPASEAAVNFGAYGLVALPVGPLAPGAHQLVTVPIPTACFAGANGRACQFDVIADNRQEIDETLETNNLRHGQCLSGRPG